MPKFRTIEPAKYDRRKHIISFKYAFNGIKLAFTTQPNFRFHITVFIIINIAAFVYKISAIEYMAVLFASALVICMEMVNTAVEAIGDKVSDGEYTKLIGVAKDVAAGGVLIAAINSVIIGLIIFLPKIIDRIDSL